MTPERSKAGSPDLRGRYVYEYPRGALTVDCVVFGRDSEGLKVLLIERGLPPFEGCWALPGGFLQLDETPEQAAARELAEETGLAGVDLQQFHTFGSVGRDPRERVVSIAHIGFVDPRAHRVQAATDARKAEWFLLDRLPALAFDHDDILTTGRERLGSRSLHSFAHLGILMSESRRPSRWG